MAVYIDFSYSGHGRAICKRRRKIRKTSSPNIVRPFNNSKRMYRLQVYISQMKQTVKSYGIHRER